MYLFFIFLFFSTFLGESIFFERGGLGRFIVHWNFSKVIPWTELFIPFVHIVTVLLETRGAHSRGSIR